MGPARSARAACVGTREKWSVVTAQPISSPLGSVEISSGIDDGGGKNDHRSEALIGFVATHRDTFEFFNLQKKFSIQMPAIYTSPCRF